MTKSLALLPIALLLLIPNTIGCGSDGGGAKGNVGPGVGAVDSDGDGIADHLEYNGYVYNWTTKQYSPWTDADVKSDPSVKYFKSDPLQISTDQDPFPDNVEATGLSMDVAVKHPGNLPMVPAYPDIVVKLERYGVTLNATITTSTGKSFYEEETWNTDTQEEHTHTEETTWTEEVNVSVSFSNVLSGSVGASKSRSDTLSDSMTNGTVKSEGGSAMEVDEWQTARSSNPTEAAHIKLYLKAYNYGTACASDIMPTLTLRIGSKNIATFEPGNSQINMLEPGTAYPADPNTYWVVDTIDTGAGVTPIALTMDELRALETGAPIDLILTQTAAQVLTMDEAGRWQDAGSWSEYMARVKAVCSRLFFDIGDGNVIDYLVYADDSNSSPKVTLRDALLWVAGAKEENNEQKITYFDRITGETAEKNLEGWNLCLDGDTWDNNGISPGDNILDSRLGPDSVVMFKAPVTIPPTIHYAYLDEGQAFVKAFASDYRGFKSVEFIKDMDTQPPVLLEMTLDEGIGYYSLELAGTYTLTGEEGIRVTNIGDLVTEQSLKVIPDVSGLYPIIDSVTLDYNIAELTVQISDSWGVETNDVRCEIIGDADYQRVLMISQGNGTWKLDMPCDVAWRSDDIIVYAKNEPGNQATSTVTERIEYLIGGVNGGSSLNLDEGRAWDFETFSQGTFTQSSWQSTVHNYDLYCAWEVIGSTIDDTDEAYAFNTNNGLKWYEISSLDTPPDGFHCLTRTDLETYEPLMTSDELLIDPAFLTPMADYSRIFIMKTTEGNLAKLTFHYFQGSGYVNDFVLFRNPADYN